MTQVPVKPQLGVKEKRRRNLEESVIRVRTQVGRLAKQPGPVLVGPFTGEVGFELLYWIPLLRWAVREFPELAGGWSSSRAAGASPGSCGSMCAYVDILSLFPPEDFARHRALADKQRHGVTEFEQHVFEAVKPMLGAHGRRVLHPSVLYQAYFRFLKINQLAYREVARGVGRTGVNGLTSVYEPIEPPDPGVLAEHLPDEYVAVRFYSATPLPRSTGGPAVRLGGDRVAEPHDATSSCSATAFDLDEHRDVRGELPDNVISVDHLMTPGEQPRAPDGGGRPREGLRRHLRRLRLPRPVPGGAVAQLQHGPRRRPSPGTTSWRSGSSRARSGATSWPCAIATCRWSNWSLVADSIDGCGRSASNGCTASSSRAAHPGDYCRQRGRNGLDMAKVKDRPPEEIRGELPACTTR